MVVDHHWWLVAMALGLGFVSFWFSEVVTELALYLGMSHLLLLSGHSQQPMRMSAHESLRGVPGYKSCSVLWPH